jgi:U3 small nucleolar RNA-associated protein 20
MKLTSMLKALASVKGPQQLFKHEFLSLVYISLVGHPDPATAQLALDCLVRYKHPHILQHADRLRRFYQKGALRDAILQYTTAVEEGVVTPQHHQLLFPLVARILFGRLSARGTGSKSSKDSPASRRSAIVSFLSNVSASDQSLYPFMYLVLRPYFPVGTPVKPVEQHDIKDQDSFLHGLTRVHPADCEKLPVQVHLGFLNLLESVVALLGHRVVSYVPAFMSVILALCRLYSIKHPTSQHDENEKLLVAERSSSVRSLCFCRLSELFTKYCSAVDFLPYTSLWDSLQISLDLLPAMSTAAERAPALLSMLEALSGDARLLPLLAQSDGATRSVVKCIDSGSKGPVMNSALGFLENLLMHDCPDGYSSSVRENDVPSAASKILQNHIRLLLDQFQKRLSSQPASPGPGTARRRLASMGVTWRRELEILCRVAPLLDRSSMDATISSCLCSVLIPFLSLERNMRESDYTNVISILQTLVCSVRCDDASLFYTDISRLLGPCQSKGGLAARGVRSGLAGLLDTIAKSCLPPAVDATEVMVKLTAVHRTQLDEMDFDVVIPALTNLYDSESRYFWLGLCRQELATNPFLVFPLVLSCFHLLFDGDGVVSRTAFKALKCFVKVCSEQAGFAHSSVPSGEEQLVWAKFMESAFIPVARNGLRCRQASVRRFYILLIREVSLSTEGTKSPNLHGDLARLANEKDADLDFFACFTHVQLHRQSRALQRLRKSLVEDTDLFQQSLSNVLLPLVLHPVYESSSQVVDAVAQEAVITAGVLAGRLSWSKYNALVWTTLGQFDRYPDQERYVTSLICSLVDAFHFDVRSDVSLSENPLGHSCGNSILRALEKRIIPRVEELLTKEKKDRSGTRFKVLRPSVALALLKLFKKLPHGTMVTKLPRLLSVLCDGLKTRDSDAREVARATLANIVLELDMSYLADILRELTISLTEGYQLHVRSACVHSILLALSGAYRPRMGEDWAEPPPFDRAVPALVDLIQQDLFGEAQERKEARDSQVSFVKEAAGSKSLHALEITASLIVFNPVESASRNCTEAFFHVWSSCPLETVSCETARAHNSIEDCAAIERMPFTNCNRFD